MSLGCGGGVVGNGKVVTDERRVPAFRELSVEGGLYAVHVEGDRALWVRTDQNLLSYVETFVEGETLVLRKRPGYQLFWSVVEVDVSNDELVGAAVSGGSRLDAHATRAGHFPLTASGGSHANVSGLDATTLHLDASGGSRVRVDGRVAELTLNDSGGSQVYAEALFATKARVDVSGGSTAKVRASQSITGEATGGSRITIYGNPASGTVSSSGGSTVSYVND